LALFTDPREQRWNCSSTCDIGYIPRATEEHNLNHRIHPRPPHHHQGTIKPKTNEQTISRNIQQTKTSCPEARQIIRTKTKARKKATQLFQFWQERNVWGSWKNSRESLENLSETIPRTEQHTTPYLTRLRSFTTTHLGTSWESNTLFTRSSTTREVGISLYFIAGTYPKEPLHIFKGRETLSEGPPQFDSVGHEILTDEEFSYLDGKETDEESE